MSDPSMGIIFRVIQGTRPAYRISANLPGSRGVASRKNVEPSVAHSRPASRVTPGRAASCGARTWTGGSCLGLAMANGGAACMSGRAPGLGPRWAWHGWSPQRPRAAAAQSAGHRRGRRRGAPGRYRADGADGRRDNLARVFAGRDGGAVGRGAGGIDGAEASLAGGVRGVACGGGMQQGGGGTRVGAAGAGSAGGGWRGGGRRGGAAALRGRAAAQPATRAETASQAPRRAAIATARKLRQAICEARCQMRDVSNDPIGGTRGSRTGGAGNDPVRGMQGRTPDASNDPIRGTRGSQTGDAGNDPIRGSAVGAEDQTWDASNDPMRGSAAEAHAAATPLDTRVGVLAKRRAGETALRAPGSPGLRVALSREVEKRSLRAKVEPRRNDPIGGSTEEAHPRGQCIQHDFIVVHRRRLFRAIRRGLWRSAARSWRVTASRAWRTCRAVRAGVWAGAGAGVPSGVVAMPSGVVRSDRMGGRLGRGPAVLGDPATRAVQ